MSPPTLADSAAAPVRGQAADADHEPRSADSANGAGAPEPRSPAPATDARTCSHCGAQLDDGQDWCLQCGAGTPGSLESGGPGWRSATTVLAITGALVLGAAAAGYAALTKSGPRRPAPHVVTVAQAPATVLPPTSTPGSSTPGSGTPGATTPGSGTPGLGIPSTSAPPASVPAPTPIKPLEGKTALPKIPLTAPTPKPTTLPKTGTTPTGTSTTPSKSATEHEPVEPTAILLDTNAASTYNPYGYPASEFGEPGLAIDNEASTAWTARVNPAVAPRLAEGLVIDLKSLQQVGELALITSTPGMVVQVYGATAHTLPESIVNPEWVPLSAPVTAKKGKTHIKLHGSTKGFRYVLLWISEAPASAVGTPKAPGHVAVNELELFPPH